MAAWLVGVGFLVKREYFKPRAVLLEEAAARVGPGASYYVLSMGGEPVGYSTSTTDTAPASITLQTNMVLDIQALGSVQRTGITQVINLTRNMRLVSFDATLAGDVARFRARGEVSGDTALDITIEAGGRPQRQRLRLTRPLVMSELVNLQLAVGGELRPGRSFTVRSFDPLLMQEREVRLTVLAESLFVVPDSAVLDSTSGLWRPASYDTIPSWLVEQSYAGVSMAAWIDRQGGIVRASSPVGFTAERTAFEIAVQNYLINRERGTTAAAGAGTDVIGSTAIAADASLEPEQLDVLRVRLRNVVLDGFDLSGGRQSLGGDTLVVRREWSPGDGRPEALLPLFRSVVPLASRGDSSVANALQPEPLVQSNDPRMAAQARQIVGRERRAGEVARILTDWVYRNLDKEITISVPSAMQVLESRQGDCNEHTVLYVALARALGLPARTAAGVVYVRGRFYYHAWPEVWLGEWVAVDPTFGQFPADAAHLRFVIGGLARQVELVRLIGQLQLEVVGSQ